MNSYGAPHKAGRSGCGRYAHDNNERWINCQAPSPEADAAHTRAGPQASAAGVGYTSTRGCVASVAAPPLSAGTSTAVNVLPSASVQHKGRCGMTTVTGGHGQECCHSCNPRPDHHSKPDFLDHRHRVRRIVWRDSENASRVTHPEGRREDRHAVASSYWSAVGHSLLDSGTLLPS